MNIFFTIEYTCRCGHSVHITDLESDPYDKFLRGIFISKGRAQDYINEIEISHQHDNSDEYSEYTKGNCQFQIRYICMSLDSWDNREDPEIDIDWSHYVDRTILMHKNFGPLDSYQYD